MIGAFTLSARLCARLCLPCAVAALVIGCATGSSSVGSTQQTPHSARGAQAAALGLDAAAPREAQAPAPPAGPVSPAAQQQAHKLAQAAASLLEAGNEEQAKAELQRALGIDPNSRLALGLMRQIGGDPLALLGRESHAYTVRPGDSLSSLAERFLGDKFAFYVLARYNDIKVPRQVASGQTLRIPGKAPPPVPSPAAPATPVLSAERDARPAPRPEPIADTRPIVDAKPIADAKPAAEAKPVADAKPTPDAKKEPGATMVAVVPAATPPKPTAPAEPTPAERALRNAQSAEAVGDLDRALAELRRATTLDPPADADKLGQTKKRLATRFAMNARGAFARQDLDGSIRNWERVLEVEPGNDTARLERQRALALKEKVRTLPK